MMRKRCPRCFAVALCLVILLFTDAMAEGSGVPVALNTNQFAVLVSAQGEQLVPSNTYGVIFSIMDAVYDDGKTFFAASKYSPVIKEEAEPAYALLDETGRQLTDFIYSSLAYDRGAVIYSKSGLFGALDSEMKELAPCEYTCLISNGAGGFLGLRTDPYDETADGVYYIDGKGNEKATGVKIISSLYSVAQGPIPAASAEGGHYGYLSPEGRWVIKPQFDWSGGFVGGFAYAQSQTGTGLINEKGNWVLTPKYTYIDTGYAAAEETPILGCVDNTQISVIDRKTFKPVAAFTGDNVNGYTTDGTMAVVTYDDKCALVDRSGKTLFVVDQGAYISLWDQLGDTLVVAGQTWGEKNSWLCDMTGAKRSGSYQSIYRLGEKDGKGYFAFAEFEVKQSSYTYDGADYSYNDEVLGTRRCGIMDEEGNVVVAPEYLNLYSLSPDLIAVETDTYAGVADCSGKILLRLELGNGGAAASGQNQP